MYSDLSGYYLRWYHSRPVAITGERRAELHRLHGVLMKCIDYFVRNYRDLVPRFMPLGDKDMEILEMQSRYPFLAGTFRPDYIISSDGRLLLCEITSRFFAHGIFMSWFGTQFAAHFAGTAGCGLSSRDRATLGTAPEGKIEINALLAGRGPLGKGREATSLEESPQPAAPEPEQTFSEMMDYMLQITGDSKRMYVFKSVDRSGEIRLYKRFYEANGMEVNIIDAEEVEPRKAEWDRPGTFLVSALNQRDILGYNTATLEAMMRRGMYSDFRNIFLIHDKRFMHLWFEDEFTSACLEADETAFLRAHAIPTYLTPPPDARGHKDRYILKPWRLGKSEGVKAGPLCTDDEWKALFDSGAVDGMICQPFINQRTVPTVWEGTAFNDYMCGMMLCVNDRLFDSGYFRCSSLPVTNVGDDRKAAVLYTDDPELLKNCDIL